jgi:hypothetical protein
MKIKVELNEMEINNIKNQGAGSWKRLTRLINSQTNQKKDRRNQLIINLINNKNRD